MELQHKLEAILFWKGEPVPIKKLSELSGSSIAETRDALAKLKENLRGRGVVLLHLEKPAHNATERDAGGEDEVALGTAPELSDLILDLQKEEFNRELSRASLETLSIILYKDGASRSLIDYIRGVNSSFTLRALSIRGLIEKTPDPEDARRFIYKPTFDLLSYMGIRSKEELPDYEKVGASVRSVEENLAEETKDGAETAS